jgi:non-canonical poly(A) RNA polymerase PAPD5/7
LLEEAIKARGIASYLEVISSAKVPIVKMDHIASRISVDICMNNDSGLKTGAIMRKFVKDYPPLRPLTMVLKMFLSQRKLHETYTGGIVVELPCRNYAYVVELYV